jgi:alkanesulfonate monooxygenase SsuD/methylene tetrahydromethanopterin reductase-like flavin-dependent oxidoreductase (luciferase family)
MEGYHLLPTSPQRTPILFQAGSSSRGRHFAARHAECVFTEAAITRWRKASFRISRQRVEAAGRNVASVLIYTALSVIAADTDAEAQAKVEDYRKHVSAEIASSVEWLPGY